MAGQQAPETRTRLPEVFISYASKDRGLAAILHGRLVAAGFSVWFDRARLNPGCDWHKEIKGGCNAARVILPLLTPSWQRSEWTRYETYASPAVLPIIAAGIRKEVVTPPLRRWQPIHLDPLAATDAEWQALFAAIRKKLAEPVPERLPFLMKLPYDPNPHFVGREGEMNRLHEELHAGPVAALVQGRVRALTALGGVGKTALANEYVRRFWRLYPQILWVNARKGYEQEFASIFDHMFPDLAHVGVEPADKAARVRNVLREPHERLLVLDNVEDEESAKNWIPREGGCRTLITSRFSGFSVTVRMINLWVLEHGASRSFLLSRTGRSPDDKEIPECDELAKRLGYLPLALEQAGAYIDEQKIGFGQYLREYEETAQVLLAEKALGSTDYPDPVITTWQRTISKFSVLARGLLRLCGCLAETPIPAAMLLDQAAKVYTYAGLEPPSGGTAARQGLRHALVEELARYSMIQHWNGNSFQVHGLVQTVELLRASEAERSAALVTTSDLITTYGPGPAFEPTNFSIWDTLFPHAETAYRRVHEKPLAPPSADLLIRLDEYSFGHGRFDRSAAYARERLELIEQQCGLYSEEMAGALVNYGESLRELSQYDQARDCFERSVSIRRVSGPSVELATSINYLAMTLNSLAESEAAYREGLEICKLAGQPECETAVKLNVNLGGTLYHQGKLAEAETVARSALAMSERVFGANHPHTLRQIDNLAVVLRERGDLSAAEPLHRRALKEREELLGPEHPDTLISVRSLAMYLQAAGDTTEAVQLFRRALQGNESVRGPDHRETLRCLNDVAGCLRVLGDARQALPLFQRAFEGCERVLGEEDHDTLATMNNLALCFQYVGDAVGALPLHQRALEGFERMLGAEHPGSLGALQNLAACLDALGRAVEAEPLHRRALDAQARKLGAGHSDVLRTENNLAHSLRKAGYPDLAERYARDCSEATTRVLGEAQPLTVHRRNNLALTLLMLQRTDEACSLLAESWTAPCPHRAVVTPAVAFFATIAALLDGTATIDPIGRLKSLLLGPELDRAPDVAHPWDVGYLLDYLRDALPSDSHEFLAALPDAINDPSLAPALDRFPRWRDTPAMPLDTPWPDAAAGVAQPETVDT